MEQLEMPLSKDKEANEKGSSEIVRMEERKRPPRNVSRPLRYRDFVEDSDRVEDTIMKKSRTDSAQLPSDDYAQWGPPVGQVLVSLARKNQIMELQCPECEFRTKNASVWLDHLRRIHSKTPDYNKPDLNEVREKVGPIRRMDAEVCEHNASTRRHCDGNKVLQYQPSNIHYARRDPLVRQVIGPLVSDSNNMELECFRCEFRTVHASEWIAHLKAIHATNPQVETTPKCVLCETHPQSVQGYIGHLRFYHKTTLKENNIYLKCSCGNETCYDARGKYIKDATGKDKKCDSRRFTLHKLEVSNASLFEPKEEPVDDYMPAENEISMQLSVGDDACKKEESIDNEEISNLTTASSPVKDEPIVDEYIQDLVRFGQIPSWDAALDQSARLIQSSPLFAAKPKPSAIRDKLRTFVNDIPSWDAALDQSVRLIQSSPSFPAEQQSSDVEDELRSFVNETKILDIFKSRKRQQITYEAKREMSATPQCILCEKYPATVYAYAYHLTHHHKYSLNANGISLRCFCGVDVRSHERHPYHRCDGTPFTLHYLRGGSSIPYAQCAICNRCVSSSYGYALHLQRRHNFNLSENGIYILCSCGCEVRKASPDFNHTKRCDGRSFTIRKLNE